MNLRLLLAVTACFSVLEPAWAWAPTPAPQPPLSVARCPSRLDYLVFASLVDSTRLVVFSGCRFQEAT